MYVDVPTNVSAIELMSSPDTPKSQILIWPCELKRILEGLMSGTRMSGNVSSNSGIRTTMDDSMDVVEVCEAF
jgi:hypothetical protein